MAEETRQSVTDKNNYTQLLFRSPKNPILTAADWPYPANTVFNPAATVLGGKTLLLARVEDRRGISHLCRATSEDGVSGWNIDPEPTLMRDLSRREELWGLEDARITWLDELKQYAVAYTAYSACGPVVSLALTEDFTHYERLGMVMPPEDKDAALFPRKINGKWYMLHRPTEDKSSHIWVSSSEDLIHWGRHTIGIAARHGAYWDANKVGLSPPPIETPEGWLVLYHGVRQTASGSIYRNGFALLALDDPAKVLRRSDGWVFGPEAHYERVGDVADVVFPCGWVLDGDTLRIYYGAADSSICLATASLAAVMNYLMACPQPEDENRNCL